MKILISDVLGKSGIEILQNAKDFEVDIKTGLSSEELNKIIPDYHGLIIRSATKVSKEVLNNASKLKVIGRAGIGVDNIDVPAATKLGIVVMNTPTGNIVSTAEHAIAMLLSLTRKIPIATSSLKNGNWDKKKLQGREVFNKILGVVGFGKIGRIVANRAMGLKMNIIVFDPLIPEAEIKKEGYKSVSFHDLCRLSDYITVHVPKIDATTNMFNKVVFDKMKKDVMLVNCARGGIVNELDLYEAIISGNVSGVALDVFEKEPPGKSKLLKLESVICTPHIAASTLEAQTNVAVMVAEQVLDYLTNGNLINAVNV